MHFMFGLQHAFTNCDHISGNWICVTGEWSATGPDISPYFSLKPAGLHLGLDAHQLSQFDLCLMSRRKVQCIYLYQLCVLAAPTILKEIL